MNDDILKSGRFPLTPTAPGPRRVPLPQRTQDDEALARLARALGHPARVRILRCLLVEGACICSQIVDWMPQAQATVSQHLKILREAGWIEGTVDGPRVCYCAKPDTATRFVDLIRNLIGRAQEEGGSHDREE